MREDKTFKIVAHFTCDNCGHEVEQEIKERDILEEESTWDCDDSRDGFDFSLKCPVCKAFQTRFLKSERT